MSKRDQLKRRRATKQVNPTYLIVCEGDVTEKNYLTDLRCHYRIPLTFRFISGCGPLTLVQKAVEEKRKRVRDFDRIWVVCDVDEHPNIPAAKVQARANSIPMAISNPCFDLWALLHFQDQNAYIDRKVLRVVCQQHMPGYAKNLPLDKWLPGLTMALERAKQLRARNQQNETVGGNPSTDADLLVLEIREAAGAPVSGLTGGTTSVR
ncbi:MAG: RloB domain-containing protein [Acidobacteriia bacterium]|nr:RloB domain-containing protein [Terriglobia bacterium]